MYFPSTRNHVNMDRGSGGEREKERSGRGENDRVYVFRKCLPLRVAYFSITPCRPERYPRTATCKSYTVIRRRTGDKGAVMSTVLAKSIPPFSRYAYDYFRYGNTTNPRRGNALHHRCSSVLFRCTTLYYVAPLFFPVRVCGKRKNVKRNAGRNVPCSRLCWYLDGREVAR